MTEKSIIVAAIQSYCRVQSEKDKDGWAALFSEDVFHEDPVGISQATGKEHMTGVFWDHIVRNDVKIWLTDDIIVCGNEAVAIMACEYGLPTERRRISPTVDHFVFTDDGQIASVRGFYNLS